MTDSANTLRHQAVRAAAIATLTLLAGCGTALDPNRGTDSDGDGLSDQRERMLGTDPALIDTDLDGVGDGAELSAGTSPLTMDSDGDGFPDGDDSANAPSRRLASVSTGNDLEPNDDFARAVVLVNTGEDARTFEGSIDRAEDVDVFDLGALDGGDRIAVEYVRRGAALLPSLALFDADGSLLDARFLLDSANRLDRVQLVDLIVREGSERGSIAITHSPQSDAVGAYRFDVRITRGTTAPPPAGQVILLNFDGGTLDPPILGFDHVAPFDAASLGDVYADDTEEIKRGVVDTMAENFAGLDVTVVTTDDPPEHRVGSVSTLLIGSLSDSALGAAVGVDPYNTDACDDGVVFAESFSPRTLGVAASPEAIAVAIGNVASHEAGHLLGLRHVTDRRAIMDESSPPIHLLFDQSFRIAPLSRSVFPIGRQDAPRMLAETVGTR